MRFLHLLAAEDPSQTHHWLLPETAEIIYGGIAALIIWWGDVRAAVSSTVVPRPTL